jgi:hypothetical protein
MDITKVTLISPKKISTTHGNSNINNTAPNDNNTDNANDDVIDQE